MAVGFSREADSFRQSRTCEFCAIKISCCSPCGCPFLQERKLDPENCSLDFVQAKIASNNMVKIARVHSMLPQSAQLSGQSLIVADDHARITTRSEILRRIKAKHTKFAHRSGFGAPSSKRKLCANRLRCVFD